MYKTEHFIHTDNSFTKVFALLQKKNNVTLRSLSLIKWKIVNGGMYYETSVNVSTAFLMLSNKLDTDKLPSEIKICKNGTTVSKSDFHYYLHQDLHFHGFK